VQPLVPPDRPEIVATRSVRPLDLAICARLSVRRKGWTLFLLVGLVVVVLRPGPAAPANAKSSRSDARLVGARLRINVLTALNRVRARHGLAKLTLSRELDAAATEHSNEMVIDGYFGHDSAGGAAYWKRIEGFYPLPKGGSWSVGENLLWAPGAIGARRALAYWMASPGHRAVLLSPRWRQVGIGILVRDNAPGVFGGRSVTVLTADFGVRR
jgi:uncharacterized protein YkwD